MMSTETPAPADPVPHDFAALKRACDAVEGASGMRLWRLARQIAQFARVHKMKGSEIARGIGRSRGYVSRALAAARLPEPHSVEDGQHICDVFHGVKSAARRIKDSAAALREAKTWARVAVKRGARPEAVELEIHQAIAGVEPTPPPSPNVSTCRNTHLTIGFQGVSTCRNIVPDEAMRHTIRFSADKTANRHSSLRGDAPPDSEVHDVVRG
jgi:hypothetical protein